MTMGRTKYRKSRGLSPAGDDCTLGPQYLNFTHPPYHAKISVHCVVCRTCVPGGTGGMLYNSTVLKPWLPLCDVCHLSAQQP